MMYELNVSPVIISKFTSCSLLSHSHAHPALVLIRILSALLDRNGTQLYNWNSLIPRLYCNWISISQLGMTTFATPCYSVMAPPSPALQLLRWAFCFLVLLGSIFPHVVHGKRNFPESWPRSSLHFCVRFSPSPYGTVQILTVSFHYISSNRDGVK